MSKQNKANKNNYDQAGRLTPDELARERTKQGEVTGSRGEERLIGRMPGAPEANRPRSEREEVD